MPGTVSKGSILEGEFQQQGISYDKAAVLVQDAETEKEVRVVTQFCTKDTEQLEEILLR